MSTPIPPFDSLNGQEYGGVVAVNTFAFISFLALFSVACRVLWLAVLQRISPATSRPREYIFFNTQLGYYAICLLIGNLFISVSGLIGFHWMVDKGISEGRLCTLQAFLMQFGEWSTAYFTVAIAIHTFNSLVLQRRQSHIVSGIAITVGWIVALLSAAGPLINPKQFKFGSGYGANGLSCAIRPIYANAEFFYHLFPIFVASVLSAVLYSIIFLVLRGTLSIKGGVKLTLDPNERLTSGGIAENYQRFVARIARSMLWYPFAYNALLVPYSITVLLSLSGFTISFGSTIFAYVCWFMLGIVNVGLLYNTFRVIGPVLESTQKETTMWSSGMYEKYDSFRSGGPWRSSEQGYPISPHRSSTIASFGNASLQSIDQPLLPIHHERYAGIPSYYNYSSPPSIGRAITPVLDLSVQRSITPPEAVMHKFSPSTERSLGLHDRRGSNESMGLPAAPRRTRSPVLHQPSVENGARSPIEVQDPRSPSSRSRHRETESNSALSSYSPQSSFNERPLSPMNTRSMSPDTLARPLPSLPRHSRSFSAVPSPALSPAPTGRQRPVLPSRHGSIGNASEFGRRQIN